MQRIILLYQFEHSAFEGVPAYSDTYIYNLYHFFYFSVITFSSVGYGDIVPVSEVARFVVMLEIFLSFAIIVFALANIKKHLLKNRVEGALGNLEAIQKETVNIVIPSPHCNRKNTGNAGQSVFA